MTLDELRERARSPTTIITVTMSLLFVGVLIDLTTRQDLIVAVVYNIPIALTGLALSRRLTLWTIGLSLLLNVAAAYENARINEGYDPITLLNRGLSGLSFLLVGVLTLAVEHAESEVRNLSDAEAEADRERRLRDVVRRLSEPMSADELIEAATKELHTLLDADAVVIAVVRDERFDEPRRTAGAADGVAQTGTLASWAVDAIPSTDRPAITVRSEQGIITTGRWRRGEKDDLIVVADRPSAAKPSTLLGEVLRSLEPLLRRAPS